MSTTSEEFVPIASPIPLEHCPLCGHASSMQRHWHEGRESSDCVVCCDRSEPICDDVIGGMCLFDLPPPRFYCATAREAAMFWNAYAVQCTYRRQIDEMPDPPEPDDPATLPRNARA